MIEVLRGGERLALEVTPRQGKDGKGQTTMGKKLSVKDLSDKKTVAEIKERVLPLLPDDLFPGGAKAGWWASCTLA